MLLCINANNTNVKFAVYDQDKPVGDWRLKTEAGRTADQYVVWLDQLMRMAGLELKQITGAIIASVVPQSIFHLTMLCEQHLKTKPLVVGDPAVKLGISVKMDIPVATVGADRLANAVGGHMTYRKPLIIVDFGTATTFDVVDYSGAYKGGIIAPGINLSLDALVNAAAKLPRVAIEAPESRSVIGRTTEEQMHIGIYWGYIAMMEGLVARLKAEIGRPVKVIATGGLATLFDQHTDLFDAIEGDLTIQGLAMLHARNPGD